MKDRNVSGEMDEAPFPADRGEDWLRMVAADPAFYLEEIEGARRK